LVIGGVSGTLLDQIHTQLRVLDYPRPIFLGQAWWVAPNFGLATIAIFFGVAPLARSFTKDGGIAEERALIRAAVPFVLAYLATGLLDGEPVFGSRAGEAVPPMDPSPSGPILLLAGLLAVLIASKLSGRARAGDPLLQRTG
jgi:hypothetical protein